MSIPHFPAGFKREMRFGNCARGSLSGVRDHAPSRWRLPMRSQQVATLPGFSGRVRVWRLFRRDMRHATCDVRERHHDFSTCDRRMSHVGSARLSSLVSRLRAHAKLSMWRTRARQSPRQDIRPKSQNFRMAAGADHAIRAKDSLQSPAQQASCQTDRYGARAEQTPFEHDQN